MDSICSRRIVLRSTMQTPEQPRIHYYHKTQSRYRVRKTPQVHNQNLPQYPHLFDLYGAAKKNFGTEHG